MLLSLPVMSANGGWWCVASHTCNLAHEESSAAVVGTSGWRVELPRRVHGLAATRKVTSASKATSSDIHTRYRWRTICRSAAAADRSAGVGPDSTAAPDEAGIRGASARAESAPFLASFFCSLAWVLAAFLASLAASLASSIGRSIQAVRVPVRPQTTVATIGCRAALRSGCCPVAGRRVSGCPSALVAAGFCFGFGD